MTTRDLILEIAAAAIGPGGKGSPKVEAIWRDVLPPSWTDTQVKQYAATKEWCGGFALWCLRRAGIAQGIHWQDGLGFLGPAHLKQTQAPQRGDIVIKPKPFWHHAIYDFESPQDDLVHVIAGNTPTVDRQRIHKPLVVFYSIEPLLRGASDTDPAPALDHPTIWLGHASMEATGYLQSLLNRHGASLKVDERFGPKTDLALRQFQASAGLNADGICGPRTWEELER